MFSESNPIFSFSKEYASLQGPFQICQVHFICPKCDIWCSFRHNSLTVGLPACSPYSFEMHMTSTASSVLASSMHGSTGASLSSYKNGDWKYNIHTKHVWGALLWIMSSLVLWTAHQLVVDLHEVCPVCSLAPPKRNLVCTPRLSCRTNPSPASRDYWKIHCESTLLASWNVKTRLTCCYQMPVLHMLSVIKG